MIPGRPVGPSGRDPIDAAVERLRSGGIVAFPTETVYGLGALALDADAVQRVFALKGRPASNPLIVHVSGIEMARGVVAAWPATAGMLADRFWPGPLTLVLPRAGAVPGVVTAGGTTVGVRCPGHPLTLRLIERASAPLVGPSANRSGRISPTTADHVRASFTEDEALVLDGGPCERGIESTVVDVTREPAVVLRAGAIPTEAIAGVIDVEPHGEAAQAPGPARSPGLVGPHYAPRAPARLFDAAEWPGVVRGAPAGTVVVTHRDDRERGDGWSIERMPSDAEAYAAALYATLHRLDAGGPPLILIEAPADATGLWRAIADRLRRATS